jgi:hypothetical protein
MCRVRGRIENTVLNTYPPSTICTIVPGSTVLFSTNLCTHVRNYLPGMGQN